MGTTIAGRWGQCGSVLAAYPWGGPPGPSLPIYIAFGPHPHLFRHLGTSVLSDAGFAYRVGQWIVALCKFRDNIVMAMDAQPHERAQAMELVRGFFEEALGLPLTCECITDLHKQCTGSCCSHMCKVMGNVLVRDRQGRGAAFAEPSALTSDPRLRLGPPLLSLHSQYRGYLGGIFTSVG